MKPKLLKIGKNAYTQEQIDQINTLLTFKKYEQSSFKDKLEINRDTPKVVEEKNIVKHLANIPISTN